MSSKPKVAISKVSDIDSMQAVELAVREAVAIACDYTALCKDKHVILKPNVYCPSPAPTTTDPRVIASLIRAAKDAGARRVTVAEGRSISTALFRKNTSTTEACFEAIGMKQAALENGADIVYLENDEFLNPSNPDALVLKHPSIPRTILEAEVLINVPVLKNHSLTLTTLGIKNLHGTISDADKLFGHDYTRIPQKLVDILHYNKPDLTVIDGVRGQEGDHADMGKVVDMGIIISGADIVAVDAVAESAIGFDNLQIDTTRLAHEQGFGVGDINEIEVVGTPVADIRRVFEKPDIEITEERFPGIKICAGDYCKGCEYYVRRGIDRLVDLDALDPNDPVTLVYGKDPSVDPNTEGKVILLGDCAMESQSVKRLRDKLWLTGRLKTVYCCPPMEFRMRALELAGD